MPNTYNLISLLVALIASSSSTHVRAHRDPGGTICDRTSQGVRFNIADAEISGCAFIALDPIFYSLLDGSNQTKELIAEHELPIFHEGPVLFEDDQELYFTTNRLGDTSAGPVWGGTAETQLDQFIDIYKLDLTTDKLTIVDPNPPIPMANGMTKTPDGKNILAASQGFDAKGGVIYELDRQTMQANPVLDTLYGSNLNALNDIKATEDGIIFFSDPVYGFEQGFRTGKPALGSNVYRFDNATQQASLMTTALQRPNGVALLDDRKNDKGCTLFLTDTGFEQSSPDDPVQQPRGFGSWGESALYYMHDDGDFCFDQVSGPWALQPIMPAARGIQDGINVHQESQLLMYCDGDGLWVWSLALFRPIGLITGGCTQLQFSQTEGVSPLYILAETQLFKTELNFDSNVFAPKSSPPTDKETDDYDRRNRRN